MSSSNSLVFICKFNIHIGNRSTVKSLDRKRYTSSERLTIAPFFFVPLGKLDCSHEEHL